MPFERPLHLFSLLRFIPAPLIVMSFVFFFALSGAAKQTRFLAGRRLHRAQSGQGQGAFTC